MANRREPTDTRTHRPLVASSTMNLANQFIINAGAPGLTKAGLAVAVINESLICPADPGKDSEAELDRIRGRRLQVCRAGD